MKKFFYTILALLLFLNFSYGQEDKGVKKVESKKKNLLKNLQNKLD